ncbi:hypothetical protein [Streptomyces prasinus]|uniref:hypothetical protein n=1 Tax=Streptomyces prasinus TaxID=67345 RepID=UPI002F4048DB
MRGQHPPAPVTRLRRQHQVREPDEPRIVLDEGGLGLPDVDERSVGGGGRGARGGML